MPLVRVAKVLRCSSEDPLFSSQNLLLTERFRKFVCHQSSQDQRIEVDLQLTSATQVTGIDLGNHGSAFVGVMVGQLDSRKDEFVTLLPETMLQTPIDARAGRHKTSVRMFQVDSLSQSSRNKEWQVVRLILRQPYKTREPFGLAFMKLQGKSQLAAAPAKLASDKVALAPGQENLAPATNNVSAMAGKDSPQQRSHVVKLSEKAAKAHSDGVRPMLPGSSSHQLPTSAGSTMAKAPQRLVMSRVRRLDTDDSSPSSKRSCSVIDGVTLRSEIAEMQARSAESSSSPGSSVTPVSNRRHGGQKKSVISSQVEAVCMSGSNVRQSAKPSLSPSSAFPSARRVGGLITPSCSTASASSSSFASSGLSASGHDFIEFEPVTPRRATPSGNCARSVLEKIDAALQSSSKQRSVTAVVEEGDGMTPRRSFLDVNNKERTPHSAGGVDFMNSYAKQVKPKLLENVKPTVLGFGGVEESFDDITGARLQQHVDDDGRVTYKKVERRPLPKAPANFKPRFKPNKQLQIGPLLARMRDSADTSETDSGTVSTGWLTTDTNGGHTLGHAASADRNRVSASHTALSPGAPYRSNMDQVSPPPVDELESEILSFLGSVDLASIDIETVTFRDMRHQFEFGRGQELEKAQHRKFLTLAKRVVEEATAADDVVIVEPTASNGDQCQSAVSIFTVECPLCLKQFPAYAVEVHASSCSG